MTEKERYFLEDTRDILFDYDGRNTIEGLKGLIDETRKRLAKFLDGKVEEKKDSL